MFDKSTWLHDLKNLIKIREDYTSEQSYRWILDNIDELLVAIDGGYSHQHVYEEFFD